ncbi:MAG TPA: caspase family protein [Pyrinomonadaceae bacterium]|nr:caspase family protein [Pyrinomonadaceae bacterium]
MKSLISLVLTISATIIAFAQVDPNRQLVQAGAPPVSSARRVALVIGNGAYTAAPGLKNPPNDARDMAAMLKTLGFEVSSGVNLNQREMKRLIREFGMKLKGGGSGLFYYAGHGVQSKGRNYLIPVDANIQSEAEVEDSGVDAALVLNFMDDAQNGLNIVILDACRNNPFARSFRSASDGLAQVDAPTGTLIAYATAPGRVASDGVGQNGLYTSELLKQMQLRDVSITDMFMRVRGEVMKQTGNKQVPWEASSLVGSFYFNGGSGAAPPPTADSKIDTNVFELSYWDTVKNSGNADDFKAYLARYPKGQFAELATNRIKTFELAAKPVEPQPVSRETGGAAEIAFWDSVKNSTNPQDFAAYLKKYPNGEFVELANNRIKMVGATSRDKEKAEYARTLAEEIAKQTKTFKVAYGYRFSLGERFWDATLTVTPEKFDFIAHDGTRVGWNCDSFSAARVDNNFIREITCGLGKCRMRTASPAEAASALESVRQVCSREKKQLQDAEASARQFLALANDRTGSIASLGVQTTDVESNPKVRLQVGNVIGAVVLEVRKGGPAEQVGIRPDDTIIALAGAPVTTSRSLVEQLMRSSPDSEVEVTILRDGVEQKVRPRLGSTSAEEWRALLHGNLGDTLLPQQKWAEAEAAFKEAVRLKPGVSRYHNDLGVALEMQKKLAEAETQYKEAVRIEPGTTLFQDNVRRVQKALKK